MRANQHPQQAFSEGSVRLRIANMQLGGAAVLQAYRQRTDATTIEALRRWDDGVRVRNIGEFERKNVAGKGTLVTRIGEAQPANGTSVQLTNE
jgi:phage baseplate assembly protein W